jgi:tetratricopeptide (TPR) repeat protein
MVRCRFAVFVCTVCFVALCFGPLAAQSVQEINRRALNEIRAGNYKEAEGLLKQALTLDKSFADTYLNYARLFRSLKKYADSNRAIQKGFELDPKHTEIREEYVKILRDELERTRKTSSPEQVIAQQRKIFDINPKEHGMAVEVIRNFLANEDLGSAKTYAQKALDANRSELAKYSSGSLGEIFFLLARIELEEKNLKAALEHAERATRYPLDDPKPAKELHKKVKEIFRGMVDDYLKNGRALMEKGQNDKALAELQKGLAFDPGNEQIQQEIDSIDYQKQAKEFHQEAMRLVAGEKWLEARDKLEIVLKYSPKDAEAKQALVKASQFEEELMKKLGRAERLPRSSMERQSMADGLLRMGTRFLEENNYKEAKISLDRCMALATIDSRLEGIANEARKAMAKIEEVDTARKTWDMAREKYRDQDFEECLKLMNQLPEDYALDMLSYYAFCYWKTGNIEKAKTSAHLALAKQPDNNRARFVLANILLAAGLNSDAYKLADEIKKSDAEYPGIDDLWHKSQAMSWGPFVIPPVIVGILLYIAYLIKGNMPEYNKNAAINRGKSFLKKGMFEECVDELTKVRRLPNVSAYDGAVISRVLAQCFLKCAAYDKAIGECKHLLSINDKDLEAHNWLGFAYLGRRVVSPESLPELLNLYKKERKNVALVGLLGGHYTSQKKLSPEGMEVLEQWYDIEPNNPDLLKALGRHYLQKGRSDDRAMKVFETMMNTGHKDSSFLLGVAKLHLRMDNYEPCLKICEQILTEEVNNEMVHPILREAYRKMGKIGDLLDIYRVFLSENPYNVAFQKGLTDCQKLMEQDASRKQDAPPLVAEPAGAGGFDTVELQENEVLCPSCGKASLNTDYYCQHCGNSLAQG